MSEPLPDRGVEDAYGYAARQLRGHAAPFLLTALVATVVAALLQLLVTLVVGRGVARFVDAVAGEHASAIRVLGVAGFAVLVLLLAVTGFLLAGLVQAVLSRGALAVTQGHAVTSRTFTSGPHAGSVVLAALLVALLAGAGTLLCYLPALAVALYAQFTLLFVLDKGQAPVAALRSSATLVQRNLGVCAGFAVVGLLACLVGLLVCGVGVVLAAPFVVLAQVHLYRSLLGEPVAG
jgi:uncharacterized membrane protein